MMSGWGSVFSVEPQERIFYALAGNVALNNCFNARPMLAAFGQTSGSTYVPRIDYTKPHNFGGVKVGVAEGNEVQQIAIDNLEFERLDLLKLDIEGMELDALRGAEKTLDRCKPIVCAEHIMVGMDALKSLLEPYGYQVQMTGMNALAIHESDPVGKRIKWYDSKAA
jgi:FkbM family methyltransferase